MNRIITILVTIFILLLLYIWISHVWGSDKPKHPQQIVDATQSEHSLGADDPSTDIDTFLNTSPDAVSSETPSKGEEATQNKTKEVEAPAKPETSKPEAVKQEPVKPTTVKTEVVKKDMTEAKKPAVTKTDSKTKSAPVQAAPAVKSNQQVAKKTSLASSSLEGKHLVIAGNFLQMVNAEQRMAELKKAGFKDVEILNFDLSEYHTVCAGRFTDVNEARRMVKKLKDYHKIDAYVRVAN